MCGVGGGAASAADKKGRDRRPKLFIPIFSALLLLLLVLALPLPVNLPLGLVTRGILDDDEGDMKGEIVGFRIAWGSKYYYYEYAGQLR